MASRMVFLGCGLLVAALLQGATAETYTVGDSLGWTIPPGGPIAYSTWANQHTFRVGDILVFNWTGSHDVARVSESDYESCTKTPIGTIQSTSPASVTLTTEEDHYFICTVSSHCSVGQKVKIDVESASGSPTSPGSPTSSPNSAASSLAVGGISAVLFSIVIAFLH
ncbi:hypothetical protein HHK36_021429 [Tetracentron sinense]|uniref:Phytocyanin domain-containing protein n=1 Tax=Tetracentron sinense TaxID=13715 RepID=A0A834YV00_TETSI|nr:hypothetical protein HHK36_021429 [Tetracentron sinense]